MGAAAPEVGEGVAGDLTRVQRYTAGDQNRAFSPNLEGKDWRMGSSAGRAGGNFSVTLPTGVFVEGLGVNGEDWTEDHVARVRFNPNGTSDEMTIVLFRPESNERRNVWLEVITGLSDIETDPAKFKAR